MVIKTNIFLQTLLRRQSHASLLQAPESVVESSSRNVVFASLHALNASLTAVGCVGLQYCTEKQACDVNKPSRPNIAIADSFH